MSDLTALATERANVLNASAAWGSDGDAQIMLALVAEVERLENKVLFNVDFAQECNDHAAAKSIEAFEKHKLLQGAYEIINDQMPGEFLEWERAARKSLGGDT